MLEKSDASHFDTMRTAQALRDAGFTEDEATAVIEMIQSSIATKADLQAMEGRLESSIKEAMAKLETRILRWAIGALLTVSGLSITILATMMYLIIRLL